MAVSWIPKAFSIFLGLSGAGITPLVMASPPPPPPPYIPPKGYRLCDTLNPSTIALFVCSKKDGSNRPSFFKKKDISSEQLKKLPKEDQWNRITEMSYSNYKVTLKFEDRTNKPLGHRLAWMRNSWTLRPEEHCTLTDSSHNGWYYVYRHLNCKEPNNLGGSHGKYDQAVNF